MTILTDADKALSERERRVLLERVLHSKKAKTMTLTELGDEFKISRERARDIEHSAIMKLRRYLIRGNLESLAIDPATYVNSESIRKLVEGETGLALQVNKLYGSPLLLIKDHWRLLFQPIEILEGSVRFQNCLSNDGITTILALCTRTEAEMMKVRNFGRKSLREVKELLHNLGLGLGSCLVWSEGGGMSRHLTWNEKEHLSRYTRAAADEFKNPDSRVIYL